MRKILAGFLATSMIVAVASSVTFAAAATITVPADDLKVTTALNGTDSSLTYKEIVNGKDQLGVDVAIHGITFNIGGESFTIPVDATLSDTLKATDDSSAAINKVKFENSITTTATVGAVTIADKTKVIAALDSDLNGKTFTVHYDGNVYTGKIGISGANIILTFDKPILDTSSPSVSASLDMTVAYRTSGLQFNDDSSTPKPYPYKASGSATNGLGSAAPSADLFSSEKPYAEVEKAGTLNKSNIYADSVVVCDGKGNPIPYTENKSGVDADQNGDDGIQSGKTLYFMIRDDGDIPKLNDDTYWKLKVTKGDNGKYIKAITDVSKSFSDGLYPLGGTTKDAKTAGRHRYIKVELNEIFTDDEYKLTLDMRISAKSKAVNAELKIGSDKVTDDSEIKVKDFYFYMKNIVKDADNDWKVGIGGLMLNPISNDWNDVTYYDEDGDLAHVKFFADSDTSKFYAKLSTKWEHADYASYFNDQDAYIFDFTGSPKLSSTSRADLEIYNPFVDEDGKETTDPANAIIYQVIDGDLFDVTSSFEYKEGDNGDMAYVTRTRFLGTYIICEKPVEEAVDNTADVPTDLVPEDTTPSEVTPDNNNGGKAPANTGKYL